VTIGVGPQPPKHEKKRRPGAAIELSTREKRVAKVASAKPATPSRSKKSAAAAPEASE
jgi:hypothetical protein